MSEEPLAFDCPSCGGPLDIKSAVNNLVACPYCGKNVIVPESLREKEKERSYSTFIQIGSTSTMRIGVGEDDDSPIDVQAFSIPQALAPQKKVSKVRISWILGIIGMVVLASIILSVAAPLIVGGLIWKDVKEMIPGPESNLPQQAPDVSSTIVTALTEVVGPLANATAAPSFYSSEMEIGEEGTGPGMFDDTRWVSIDAEGNLYTAEYQDGRVQKFSPEGSFDLLWNVKSRVPLMDIAVSRGGILYLTIGGEILKFDSSTGEMLGSVVYPQKHYFAALAPTLDGGLMAVSDGDTVVRFDSNEQVTLTIPKAVSSISEEIESGARLAVDGRGNIYILATTHEGVFVYSPEGKFLNRIGSAGTGSEQLASAHDIVVDGKGRVFISDIKGVMIFSTDGRYEGIIDVEGSPFGMALDDQNRLIVMTNAPKLYKFALSDWIE